MAHRARRAEVLEDQTWNLVDIYATPEQWWEDAAQVGPDVATLSASIAQLDLSPAALLACLGAYDTVALRLHRLRRYAYFSLAADGSDPAAQAMSAEGEALASLVETARSALASSLMTLPDTLIDEFSAREPALEPFAPLLSELQRDRDRALSPDAEHVLAALSGALQAPQAIWQMATAVDMACSPVRDSSGRELPVSIASYLAVLSQSPERALRQEAYASLSSGLDRLKATLGTALATHITHNVTVARLRGYRSATEMLLRRQLVPEAVYHQVLDVVHDTIAPHVRRLMLLRARVLGVSHLQRYDLEAPLDPAFTPATTFDDCSRMIPEALQLFGAPYGALLGRAFTQRWIDRADNLGKRSGAFCWPVAGVHPYVFMTWRDTLRNAFTLAHELGHGAHYQFALQAQPLSTFSQDAVTLIVEAPSTANELLLAHSLLAQAQEPRLRRWLTVQSLSTFLHNMVTHMLEGHFERRLYELAEGGKPLTISTILETQGEVFERFYAGTVVLDDAATLYWAQQPHFYMNLFPYAYSAGLACSYSAVAAMLEEGAPAVKRWLDMLRLGSTLPPLELARRGGVDLADPETLRRATAYFGSLVDELELAF